MELDRIDVEVSGADVIVEGPDEEALRAVVKWPDVLRGVDVVEVWDAIVVEEMGVVVKRCDDVLGWSDVEEANVVVKWSDVLRGVDVEEGGREVVSTELEVELNRIDVEVSGADVIVEGPDEEALRAVVKWSDVLIGVDVVEKVFKVEV